MTQPTRSQWDNLLCNLGDWRGSFTRLSPQGIVKEDIPTQVTLEGLNQNQTVRQVIRHFSETGEVSQEKVLEYSSLNRSTLFFEDGAFSQGSIQFGPFSEFGAELGFIRGDRRLRLVQLFDTHSSLSSLTLIREHRAGTEAAEHPTLTVEQLIGEWHGEATTLYSDWRSPDCYASQLIVQREGDRLHQKLIAPNLELNSSAQIQPNLLLFDQGSYPIQVLLLPDGASSNTPLAIPKGKPFFLEAGWLVQPGLRQRLIRSYDAQGGWVSLTLVTEHKT
ncbi:DUF3598 family protein [Leptolyngbya sp. FACHB-671]|uniref:DUF3598 family protein n=1 Tax=Leptolyngbya sp. FACHB-671 TaxID=2692812 RepID=UPI001684BC38|nr:DUF3598 family protein [Leptolyngbya sp. FACHB-671]MBD1866381.1 DUF3598 family protein [Cyanobacteria bacterium FACHB-471]MBD2071382.1 DUF3598 family protein [Leptolyngbya sp. FACHB-671]